MNNCATCKHNLIILLLIFFLLIHGYFSTLRNSKCFESPKLQTLTKSQLCACSTYLNTTV